MHTASYDIIIVGGGMVGLTLACALAQQTRLSIAILEAHPPSFNFTNTYHHRVSAIALSSQRIFKALHIWDAIQAQRVSPFTQIRVWDAAGQGEIQFSHDDIAVPLLGYIIENQVLQAALADKIKQHSQITYLAPVELSACHFKASHVECITTDNQKLTAALAVAADGAHSWLRTEARIAIDKEDYEQAALVATVRTGLPHHQVAQQVFLETGPLAFLPLADAELSSIVWSLPTAEAKRCMALEMDAFKRELTQAFSERLGTVVEVTDRRVFPLHKQQAKHYVQARLALVGDAAHTIHPLAGQGANMGLLDAASLAEVIADACSSRRDFASIATLRRYERWRKADNLALLVGVDAIKYLFASDKVWLQQLRSFGLNTTDRIRWIKNIFTRHAVGARGDLPKMAK